MNTCLNCGKEIEKGDMCNECRKEDLEIKDRTYG